MARTRSSNKPPTVNESPPRNQREPDVVASTSGNQGTRPTKTPRRKRRVAACSTGGRPRNQPRLDVPPVIDLPSDPVEDSDDDLWGSHSLQVDADDEESVAVTDDDFGGPHVEDLDNPTPSTSRGIRQAAAAPFQSQQAGNGSSSRKRKVVHGGGEAATSDPPAKFRDVPIKLEFSDEHQATSALPLVTSAEASTQAGNDSLYPPVKFEMMMLYEDAKTQLECPVCNKICLPPVMQCRNGHVTCNNCRNKVRSCPTCREIDINIRNLFAERAVAHMTIPCEFAHHGCTHEMPYRERDQHQRHCKFRPFRCPYIECGREFVASHVVPHVYEEHKEDCRTSDGPEITASMILIGSFFGGDGAWSPRVISCFGRTFFDVALTRDKLLHHWVWLLGEEDEAQEYTYEITAFKGNIRYMYAGEVASLRSSDEEIVSTGQCLSINDGMGKRLRETDKDDKDKIRYRLKLYKNTGQPEAHEGGAGLPPTIELLHH